MYQLPKEDRLCGVDYLTDDGKGLTIPRVEEYCCASQEPIIDKSVVTTPELPSLGDAKRSKIYLTEDNKLHIMNYKGDGWLELAVFERVEEEPADYNVEV